MDPNKNSVYTFPKFDVPKEEKLKDSYGLSYVRAMWYEWTKNSSVYNSNVEQFKINRQYAEGLENFDKYKDRFNLNGDTSWLNLDFTPVNRIAALVDNIEGKLTNQMYRIQCNPIDVISKTQEEKDRNKMYAEMFLKSQVGDLEQLTGIPMYPRNTYIPQDEEEAQLYFKMNYKQASAIAMEQALQFVFMNNDFDTITRKKIIRDLIVIKKAALKRYYDENNNIRVKYVDPVDLIHPYSKHDDFRSIEYVGEQELLRIGDIAQMTDKFTTEQLADIAKRYQGRYGNPDWDNNWNTGFGAYYPGTNGLGTMAPYYSFYVPVVNFAFLSTCKEKWVKTTKKNGRVFVDKKSDNYETTQENKEVIAKNIEYVFEGYWIVGSDLIYNYGIQKNIPREKDNGSYSPKATLPIAIIAPNIYDMQNKSLVERAIPHEDQLNLINLKIQQLVVNAKPPGAMINKEALSGIMLGQGTDAAKPEDIYKMYAQTGSFVYSDLRDDGNVINGKPIDFLENGIGRDFAALLTARNAEMEIINSVLSYNSAVDASSPDTEAVVGAAKMAIQATNNALRPLFQSSVQLIEKISRGLGLMVQDSIEGNYDAFVRAIGSQATETIKYGRKLALNQFAIKVELLPDDEEKMQLEQLIAVAQEKESLTTSDILLIRQEMKQDVKLAGQLMVHLENKNRKNRMAEEKAKVDYNAQQQQQSAVVTAQATAETEASINKGKADLLVLEYTLKSKLSAQEHGQDMQLEDKKGQNALMEQEAQHNHTIRGEAFKGAINTESAPAL